MGPGGGRTHWACGEDQQQEVAGLDQVGWGWGEDRLSPAGKDGQAGSQAGRQATVVLLGWVTPRGDSASPCTRTCHSVDTKARHRSPLSCLLCPPWWWKAGDRKVGRPKHSGSAWATL
jgi:hypothetical protein